MRKIAFLVLCAFSVCSASMVPGFADTAAAAAAQPAPQAKPAPKPAGNAPAASAADKVQSDLDTYAQWYLQTMNKEIRPGMSSKEVVKHPDGFIARYMQIDPASLKTSYSVSENKAVAYIGRVMFHRVEYVCIAKSKEQALAGPFVEANRQPVTELIMHMKGKWTYRY